MTNVVVIESDTPVTKKPEPSLPKKMGREPEPMSQAARARKLHGLTRLIWQNHRNIFFAFYICEYEGRTVRKGYPEIDRCFSCIARQRTFETVFETIEDAKFRASLKSEMYEWRLGDVVWYADALDLAYLSVLKKSQAEKAAALRLLRSLQARTSRLLKRRGIPLRKR